MVDETAPRRRPGRPRLTQPSPEYLGRRDEIVDAAAKVFGTRGYRASTLEDVAEALGLRRASLYHYVRSKSELLSMICERALARGLRSIDEINHIDDPAERLVALIRMHSTLIARDRAMSTVFFDEKTVLPKGDRATVEDTHRRYFAAFTATIKASMEAGVLPPADPRLSALAIVGMVTWIYKWFESGRDSADDFADTCVTLLLAPRPQRPPRHKSAGASNPSNRGS
jgi:AcrR family transcriptional regulator